MMIDEWMDDCNEWVGDNIKDDFFELHNRLPTKEEFTNLFEIYWDNKRYEQELEMEKGI